jgi:hypothetical protein
MQLCLRDEAGEPVPARFEPCMAELRARRDAY